METNIKGRQTNTGEIYELKYKVNRQTESIDRFANTHDRQIDTRAPETDRQTRIKGLTLVGLLRMRLWLFTV